MQQSRIQILLARDGHIPLTDCSFTYTVFGLSLRSNEQIPGLTLAKQPASDPAVGIHLNDSPPGTRILPSFHERLAYVSPYNDEAGDAALKMWSIGGGDFSRLAYSDGTQFWLNREGTEIWATWPENLTIEDVATYLLGPVLGLLLRLRGVTCLHASAVAFGEQAVAFVGSEGAGKSTTAAALALRGHAILSDDVVALAERNGSFFVHPPIPISAFGPNRYNPSTVPRMCSRNLARATKNGGLRLGSKNCASKNDHCLWGRFIFWENGEAIPRRWCKRSRRKRRSSRW